MLKIKKTKYLKFARFGGLSAIPQQGYEKTTDRFHAPPVRKGIYAFVWPYIEPFLLTGRPVYDPDSKYNWIKDSQGKRIPWTEENEVLQSGRRLWLEDRQGNPFLAEPKPMKTFVYEGLVWHHLGRHLRPEQVLKRKDSWVLSTTEDHREAFFKELHMFKNFSLRNYHQRPAGSQPPVKGDQSWVDDRFSWDHLEVFIEKV